MVVGPPLSDCRPLLLFSANHEPQPRRCLQDRMTAVEQGNSYNKGKTKHIECCSFV